MADYQLALSREIDARLKSKCDNLADAFVDDIGNFMYPLPFSHIYLPSSLYMPVCFTVLACCLETTHPSFIMFCPKIHYVL